MWEHATKWSGQWTKVYELLMQEPLCAIYDECSIIIWNAYQ